MRIFNMERNLTRKQYVVFITLFFMGLQGCSTTKQAEIKHNGWQNECLSNQYTIENNAFDTSLYYKFHKTKRCEIATHELIKMDQPFDMTFIFTTANIEMNDPEWHLIFQIHSFPDAGEKWRCPVLSLEVVKGTLRMTNRWDLMQISYLEDGTCAAPKNSIKRREIFSHYIFEPDLKYKIRIVGKLATDETGKLQISINNKVLGDFHGPNTFNDKRGPYLKFGIYKPTWWANKEAISYQYTDFIFNGEQQWK